MSEVYEETTRIRQGFYMFLSLSEPAVAAIVCVVAAQYVLATLCLVKLARIEMTKKQYIKWNLLIIFAFFVGEIIFLVWYLRVGRNKTVPAFVPPEPQPEEEITVVEDIYEEAPDNATPTDAAE